MGNACYQLFNEFFMSLVLMLGTFGLIMFLKNMRNRPYFRTFVRTTCEIIVLRDNDCRCVAL